MALAQLLQKAAPSMATTTVRRFGSYSVAHAIVCRKFGNEGAKVAAPAALNALRTIVHQAAPQKVVETTAVPSKQKASKRKSHLGCGNHFCFDRLFISTNAGPVFCWIQNPKVRRNRDSD